MGDFGSSPEWKLAPLDGAASPSRHRRVLGAISTIAAVALLSVVVWGFRYHPGYDETVPGDAQPIAARVTIGGAKQYEPEGDFYLVFVRERQDLNYWEYLKAKWFDDHAEITKIQKGSQPASRQESLCMMSDSQAVAKQVALEKLGYTLSKKPGVLVSAIADRSAPVAEALECGDVIREVDGVEITELSTLSEVIGKHAKGETVRVGFDRKGARKEADIQLISAPDGRPILGVLPSLIIDYPVELTIDTGAIGGPSAGLAMTLTLLDELTPGELTGNRRVVATGEILRDGGVGEIGAVELKAVAAKNRDADIFFVPTCQADPKKYPDALRACQAGIQKARDNAKGVKIIPVATLDEALRALVDNGGDALPDISKN